MASEDAEVTPSPEDTPGEAAPDTTDTEADRAAADPVPHNEDAALQDSVQSTAEEQKTSSVNEATAEGPQRAPVTADVDQPDETDPPASDSGVTPQEAGDPEEATVSDAPQSAEDAPAAPATKPADGEALEAVTGEESSPTEQTGSDLAPDPTSEPAVVRQSVEAAEPDVDPEDSPTPETYAEVVEEESAAEETTMESVSAATTAQPEAAEENDGGGAMGEARSEPPASPPPEADAAIHAEAESEADPAPDSPDGGPAAATDDLDGAQGDSPASEAEPADPPAAANPLGERLETVEESGDESHPTPPSAPAHQRQPPSTSIEVEVYQGQGLPRKLLHVAVDREELRSKEYIGGYRNKKSGALYHHAMSQTPTQTKPAPPDPKYERQTQTVHINSRSVQSNRECSTQMDRPGIYLDHTPHYELLPGPYQTSEELIAIKTAATIMIQRVTRGLFARRRAQELRQRKSERDEFLKAEQEAASAAAVAYRQKEIERRLNPRSGADFELLYNEIEAWRLQETRSIKALGLPPDLEQARLAKHLAKLTSYLQRIDRLKTRANGVNKEARINKTLYSMSKPGAWELRNGVRVEVHTPYTTRARELAELYHGLKLTGLTIEERLDVLLHVKWTVKEFDCNLTRDIVDLINREADLLNRARSPKTLEGLRKRIAGLFLAFIETPEFNPEAIKYQITPYAATDSYLHVNTAGTQTLGNTV